MSIRLATLHDIPNIYPLIRIIWEDMSHPLLTLLDETTFEQTMLDLMKRTDSKFSYKNALVYADNEAIVGVLYGYDGNKETEYDKQLIDYIQQHFPNIDTTPLQMTRESCDTEWYLDSLVVNEKHRQKGIGKDFFNYLHTTFQNRTIGLNCETINTNAYQLYTKMGYTPAYHTQFLGHDYIHMQKSI